MIHSVYKFKVKIEENDDWFYATIYLSPGVSGHFGVNRIINTPSDQFSASVQSLSEFGLDIADERLEFVGTINTID